MKKKILSVILAIVIICCSANVFAINAEYEDANNKEQQAQEKLNNVQDAKSQALQEIQKIQESIEKVENEISSLNTKIEELTTSISEKAEEIETKQKEYERKEDILKQRMVVLYEAGQTSYLEVLLTSKSITDFISKYYLMSEIAEADSEVLNEIEKTKNEIQEAKQKMEQEKEELDSAKEEKTKKNKELLSRKNEKQSKVDSLTEEEKKLQNEIDEYENTKRRIEAIEAEARRKAQLEQQNASSNLSGSSSVSETGSSSVKGTGQLTWPVPGYTSITSYYGYRIHPIYGIYKLHNGIDVGAPGGAQFVAADSGTVILAEYYGGYGNCVVIDHGNGMFTRYAHGTSILVSAGQKVTRGTPVLTVGSTGLSTGNHAHFEVSINGSTVDPLNYL